MEGLIAMVSRSLGVSVTEADTIIEEQVRIGHDMLTNGSLEYDDVVGLMADVGVEPDNMDEFLMRIM